MGLLAFFLPALSSYALKWTGQSIKALGKSISFHNILIKVGNFLRRSGKHCLGEGWSKYAANEDINFEESIPTENWYSRLMQRWGWSSVTVRSLSEAGSSNRLPEHQGNPASMSQPIKPFDEASNLVNVPNVGYGS